MSIYLKVTNRCNIRCPHCFISDYNGDMSLSIVEKVAERYPSGRIIFHGGEPTLMGVDYIKSAIEILGNREFVMQSNLIMPTDDIYRWVDISNEHFNSSIGTSIDYGRMPYLEQWTVNVRKLKEAGISVIATVTVTDNVSVEEVCNMVSLFESCGGDGFYLQVATPVRGATVSQYHYISVWERLKKHPLNLTSKRVNNAITSSCNISGINGGNCAKNGVRTIDPDGTVYICPDFAGQKVFPLGNLNDREFDDSIRNPNNDIFYEREKNLILSCSEDCWSYCNGGCASFAYFSGQVEYKDPYCDVYQRFFVYADY